ncbi:MAG: MFS transporter [Deferribacteraceae bacterium]|nr:MFS transporter [Deferribacteraceae bacterium]
MFLLSASFLASAAFMLLLPVLPVFATEVVRLEEGRVGLVVGAFSLTALLCRPFIGHLLDNYNRKITLLIALAMFTGAFASYIFTVAVAMLLLVRMAHGISWAGLTTSAATIIADIVPAEKRGAGIGYFSMTIPLAMVIGPALGLVILNFSGSFQLVFIFSVFLSAISFIIAGLLKLPTVVRPKKKLALSFPALYEKRAAGLAFMQFCYSFAYGSIITFLPIYAHKNNIDNSGAFFILYAAGVLLSRFLVRNTLDLRGPTPLVLSGYLCFAAGGFSLAFATSPAIFFVSGSLAGFGGGMVMPTISTMTMNVVEPFNRGKANATVGTAMDVGMGLGALGAGCLIQQTSYETAYITGAALMCLPLLWYFLSEKNRYYMNLERLRKEL